MSKHIVKVQRSITPSDGRILIYDKDRTILGEFDMTDVLEEWFRPGELKLYFEATFQDGVLTLGDHLSPLGLLS